ncbi:unnamed protein product [Microthlaspi erraticum]|uniref:S1 motif domain-containing protein n=1 Tax=Microthlaspi erraticum TaxID=1685480 RepID=A0A6D2JC73_9BRAS|nr:unnamed protein product [Microthlaspi erraticum]
MTIETFLKLCLEYLSREENVNSSLSSYLLWNHEINKSFRELTSTERIQMTEALDQMEQDANVVGNSFVFHYYMRCNEKREMNYTTHAIVARPDNQNILTVIRWKKNIVKLVNSFMDKTCSHQILSAYSHASYNYGITTLVSGVLTTEDGKRQVFCQNLFLVPETTQGRYLAMNDLLRYLCVEIEGDVSSNRFIKDYYICGGDKYYVEGSCLSRQTSGGDMVSFNDLKSIKDHITSSHSQTSNIDIFTADSQPSFNRSVIMLVTGSMTLKDGGKKTFIQSFLLVPNEDTYIIWDDIQMYVEIDSQGELPPKFDGNKDRSFDRLRQFELAKLQAAELAEGTHLDWCKAESLFKTELLAEVELISSSTRGFVVSLGSLIGFLPYRNLAAKWKFVDFESWLRRKGVEDPSLTIKAPSPDLVMVYERQKQKFMSSFVGRKIRLYVIKANRQQRTLVFGMRPRGNEGELVRKRELMNKLVVGDVVKCCITKITYFGIFCEVQGFPALIHHSEVSWDSPLKIGQVVEAKVHQLDFPHLRINLSLKSL